MHSVGFAFSILPTEGAIAWRSILFFGAIYLVLAGGVSLAIRSWHPVAAFAWLIGIKLWSVLVAAPATASQQVYAQQMLEI